VEDKQKAAGLHRTGLPAKYRIGREYDHREEKIRLGGGGTDGPIKGEKTGRKNLLWRSYLR